MVYVAFEGFPCKEDRTFRGKTLEVVHRDGFCLKINKSNSGAIRCNDNGPVDCLKYCESVPLPNTVSHVQRDHWWSEDPFHT
jgi:hypothetical protein